MHAPGSDVAVLDRLGAKAHTVQAPTQLLGQARRPTGLDEAIPDFPHLVLVGLRLLLHGLLLELLGLFQSALDVLAGYMNPFGGMHEVTSPQA